MNVIARLDYELAYYDSAVHRFNHYTTRTPPDYERDGYTNRNCPPLKTIPKIIYTGTGRLGNKKTISDHLNYSIIKMWPKSWSYSFSLISSFLMWFLYEMFLMNGIIISCLHFWDEACWFFLSLRFFGLLPSSLLLFPQQDTWRNGYRRWFPELLKRQSSEGCKFNPHYRRVIYRKT